MVKSHGKWSRDAQKGWAKRASQNVDLYEPFEWEDMEKVYND